MTADPATPPASAATEPPARQVHWMVRLNHRNRTTYFSLLAVVFGLHLVQIQAGWTIWLLTLLLLVALPQLFWAWAVHLSGKAQQRRAELASMHLEAMLFTLWCAALGFPLMPSFILLAAMCMNLVVFEGLRGLRNLALAVLAGLVAAVVLVHPWHFSPSTSVLVTLLCMAVLVSFLATFSHSSHVRAVQLYESRQQAERQLAEIRTLEAQLREAALRDPLTGLHNRRHLSDALPSALSRCARAGMPLTLVMIDVDHFKQLNDTHGHPAGDTMLKALALLLLAHVRQGDVVCRVGGEEFLLVLENATLQAAWDRAEILRASFASLGIIHEGVTLHATVSCGLATFPEQAGDAQSLLQAADRALYAAKTGGRNQLQAAPPVT